MQTNRFRTFHNRVNRTTQRGFSTPASSTRMTGALRVRNNRTQWLLAGCGDVGLRMIDLLGGRGQRIVATCRRAEQAQAIAQRGALPLRGDLGDRAFLRRLAALARDGLIWLAPPPSAGSNDPYCLRMRAAIGARAVIRPSAGICSGASLTVVYVSTTGVYGDRAGQWTDETVQTRPANARAVRRVAAEDVWRGRSARFAASRKGARSQRITDKFTGNFTGNFTGKFTGNFIGGFNLLRSVSILRAPGIYAADRLPLDRIRAALPAIETSDDSWSNHIHAHDLARLSWKARFRGQGRRVFNAVDQSPMRMGDYFDLVADHFKLPRPPRMPRQTVRQQVSPMMWSFMTESRRLDSKRLGELGIALRYPTVASFLAELDSGPTTER